LTSEKSYYVVSPKDIIVVKLADVDDHITWLKDHYRFRNPTSSLLYGPSAAMCKQIILTLFVSDSIDRFEEALQVALEERTQRLPDIADAFLSHLFSTNKLDVAVKRIPVLLNTDKDLWDKWALSFVEYGRVVDLAPYIPIFPKLKMKFVLNFSCVPSSVVRLLSSYYCAGFTPPCCFR
jgi:hypothetical protein